MSTLLRFRSRASRSASGLACPYSFLPSGAGALAVLALGSASLPPDAAAPSCCLRNNPYAAPSAVPVPQGCKELVDSGYIRR